MISKTQIKYMSGAASYARGLDIYLDGKVLDMDVQDFGSYDEVVASVKGSGRNIYEVDVSVDKEDNQIDNIYCECPAYGEYDGICKHCVAVLLEYNEYAARQQVDPQKLNQLKGVKKGITMHTTPELAQLLQKQAVAKSLPLIQGSTYGKVRLEPYFDFDGRTFTVEFKIGTNKMYVLKDAFSFDNNMSDQTDYKYGKNLQFVHTIESFDEESKPLAKFICKWADNNRQFHRSSSYYGYYMGSLEKVRHLDLAGNELAEFLLLMEGRILQGESVGTRNKTWEVTREHLPRKITITGMKQGIELKVSKFICAARTNQYRICFFDKKIYIENMEELLPVKDFLDSLSLISGETAFIENKDVPAFCQELLPVIQKFFKCRMVEFDPENYGMIKPEFQFYLDAPQENMITCGATVGYGDREFSLYTTDDIAIRDMNKETVVRNVIHKYSNAFHPFEQCAVIADDEEAEYEFLTEGIPALQAVGEVFISDALKRIEVRNSPKITVGVSLSGNLLELSMTAGDMSREDLLDILSRYNKKKKFYRLKNGAFVNAADSGLDTVEELRTGLQLTDKQMKQDRIEVQKYRALYLDAQLKENPVVSAVKDKSFKSLVRNMKTVEDNDFEVPESLDKVLREYQKRGFLWIKTLRHNGFGGILADDMGLGKTLQVIALLTAFYQEKTEQKAAGNEGGGSELPLPSLIVCPASLVYNWGQEFARFSPEIRVLLIAGTAKERQEQLEEQMRMEASERAQVIITSYDLLKRDRAAYLGRTFEYEIIDEAQVIKNAKTQGAKAVKEISANVRFALTGTPVENRLSELWSIFDFLMPGFLYSYRKFRERYELPIVKNQDPEALTALRRMTGPFVLRRLKKDVLRELPGKEERIVYSAASGRQQKLYTASALKLKEALAGGAWSGNGKLEVLSQLMRLRQICCDPALCFEDYTGESAKLETCVSLIASASAAGHKILLFSQFASMLERIRERLLQEGISSHLLVGATPKEERSRMVQAFALDEVPVFLISLKAGGTGLNLTAADIVIHYDPWWNVAAQNQATDRAYWIGQEKPVTVYKLILKDTIEENLLKLQNAKLALAAQVGSEGMVSLGDLSQNELMELFEQNP